MAKEQEWVVAGGPAKHLSGPGSPGVRDGLSPLKPPYWLAVARDGALRTMRRAREVLWSSYASRDFEFVQGLLEELARWVLDLPASERHHHSRPRGLYRHSLEVAASSLDFLVADWDQTKGDRSLTPAERIFGLKVAFAVGLFHDVGKVLDVEVRLSDRGAAWDPFQESLAAYRTRHGWDPARPTPCAFRPGRGIGHEHRVLPLVQVILSHRQWDWLRHLLMDGLILFAARGGIPDSPPAATLEWIVYRVHSADHRSASEGHPKKSKQESVL
jgi:hypothetical protein